MWNNYSNALPWIEKRNETLLLVWGWMFALSGKMSACAWNEKRQWINSVARRLRAPLCLIQSAWQIEATNAVDQHQLTWAAYLLTNARLYVGWLFVRPFKFTLHWKWTKRRGRPLNWHHMRNSGNLTSSSLSSSVKAVLTTSFHLQSVTAASKPVGIKPLHVDFIIPIWPSEMKWRWVGCDIENLSVFRKTGS